MLRIKNTALEPSKALQLRQASKLEMEPMINGQRLRLRSSMDVPEEWAQKNKDYLERLWKHGVIDIEMSKTPERDPQLNAEGLKLGGPTLEKFMAAGYKADRYPPPGWAEVPSAGLTAYRKELADKAAADAKAKEEAEIAAMIAAEEEARKQIEAEEAAKKAALEVASSVPMADSLTMTTEPAGAPVAEVAPPPAAPAVEERPVDSGKKGSGKSKLK